MNWSLGVKSEAKLAGMALRVIPLVFGHLTAGRVKVVWGFSRNASTMYRRVGPKGLAIFLKTCYLLLQHVAGGQKDKDPFGFGCNVSRTRRGVPRIINTMHRKLILSGDIEVIRLWLKLFGLYRVIPFKGSLKLSTIISPGKELKGEFLNAWEGWVPVYLARLSKVTKLPMEIDPSRDLKVTSIPTITKSSPNSGGFGASAGLPLDLLVWWMDTEMNQILSEWMRATSSRAINFELESIFSAFGRLRDDLIRRQPRKMRRSPCDWLQTSNEVHSREQLALSIWGKPLFFGRLGFKEEPGKIRVFAMVNLITQALMKPLHEWIFTRLRAVPTDGTFDQLGPVSRLLDRFKGEEWFASYDLSAATDRLPVAIQVALLKPLLGEKLAGLWAYVLVGRPYGLPKVAKSYNLGFMSVYYKVGQPMGALSSWAMLAMTHHAIVQYAAFLAYPEQPLWFSKYALLGDDIVIADKAVAEKYLVLMDTIGVEVGIAKSLVSSIKSLEFAKRTWIRGQDATPISLAELSVAASNLAALEELWRKVKKSREISMANVARFSGFGYKNLARLPVAFGLNNRLSRLLGYLCRPGGLFPMTFESWVMSRGPGYPVGLDWREARVVAQLLVDDITSLISKNLERSKEQINGVLGLRLFDAEHKVLQRVEGVPGPQRRRRVSKPVYARSLKKGFGDLTRLIEPFFKDWVLYPFVSPLSRKASGLTVRLREFVERKSVAGFTGLESTWLWIADAESGLKALPSEIDLFTREDPEERVRPSSVIRVWMQCRKKVFRRPKGPENRPAEAK